MLWDEAGQDSGCKGIPQAAKYVVGSLRRSGSGRVHVGIINLSVLFNWNQVLPSVLQDPSRIHRELVAYITNLPGKNGPSTSFSAAKSGLNKLV